MTYDYRADAILGGTLAYWVRKRGARAMPCRRDIDPTEMKPTLLPHLQIIEVLDGGACFLYRLVGTAVVEAFGKDYTGSRPDEMFPSDRGIFIHGVYRSVCSGRQPLFSRNKYQTTKSVDIIANRIYLPLSGNGRDVDFILGVLTFEFGQGARGGSWGSDAKLDPSAQYIETIDLTAPIAA